MTPLWKKALFEDILLDPISNGHLKKKKFEMIYSSLKKAETDTYHPPPLSKKINKKYEQRGTPCVL